MQTVQRSAPSILLLAVACALPACGSGEGGAPSSAVATSAAKPLRPELHEYGTVHANKQICEPSSRSVSCDIRVQTDEDGNFIFIPPGLLATPSGWGATDLESAYNVPTTIESGTTIAIVDYNDDATAEADLAVYRAIYGLPPCTTANGCFKKMMIGALPTAPTGQQGEISLDIEMASAGCPSCKILLVEDDDDFGGINVAVAEGATVVSLSWGQPEFPGENAFDQAYLNHPGVAIFAITGDGGYVPVLYPASSPFVIAVGGTSLYKTPAQPFGSNRPSRFWTETAWSGTPNVSGAGSGCSVYTPKPSWQTDPGCSMRTLADVSAVADPDTGVAIYSTGVGGWFVSAGTSASTPLVAGIYAQTRIGGTQSAIPAWYENASTWAYDVTGGSTGPCGTYLCNGVPGYDGPTGIGSPNGARMAHSPEITAISPNASVAFSVTVTITGANFSTVPGWTQVTFNGIPATGVTCSSDTMCTATLPPTNAPATGDIVVSVEGHKSPTGSQDQFTFEQTTFPRLR